MTSCLEINNMFHPLSYNFMKKLIYLLLVLPVLLVSCHDDNDLPDVSVGVEYENGTPVNNKVYVVKGSNLAVKSVDVVSNVKDRSAGVFGGVAYTFCGIPVMFGTDVYGNPVYVNYVAPFGVSFYTEDLEPGDYYYTMEFGVAQEGCELATVFANVPVVVVASVEDIPASTGDSSKAMIDFKFK